MRIPGIRGEASPADVEVCLNPFGDHRNQVTSVLTGDRLEVEEAIARAQVETSALLTSESPPSEPSAGCSGCGACRLGVAGAGNCLRVVRREVTEGVSTAGHAGTLAGRV